MPKAVKKAFDSFRAQKGRCRDINHIYFHYYGGRGIKVQYQSREFIGWYLEQYAKKKWKDPTVGRIDHDKDYSFENVEMQERFDNQRERHIRRPTRGLPKPKIMRKVVAFDKGVPFATFFSLKYTSEFFKKPRQSVIRLCQGKTKKTRNGLTFRYHKDQHAPVS